MRTLTKLLGLLVLLLCTASAEAAPFREGEFTDKDLLVVSRMAVLEAGWTNHVEHTTMAFVQLNRWRASRDAHPYYRDQVVDYCPGLRRSRKRRQRWVGELTLEGNRPPSFPRRLSWDKHRRWWMRVVHNMRMWSEGRRRDPFRGRAWHWRSPVDPPTTARPLKQVEGLNNVYYGRRVK